MTLNHLSSSVTAGQVFRGRLGFYTLSNQLHRSDSKQAVVVKCERRDRIENEREILRRFSPVAPSLRPLIDVIEEPSEPPALVLKYLDDDLLHASNAMKLSRREVKHVARKVLEALATLHSQGFVHTDVKPDNVLVNYTHDKAAKIRFADVMLADFAETVHETSEQAVDSEIIGAAIFRSPEAMMQNGWTTATDIWSFGAMLISLLLGKNTHIFRPDDAQPGDDGYEMKILIKHDQYFGPFPKSYCDPGFARAHVLPIVLFVLQAVSSDKRTPFSWVSERQFSKEDKALLLKIMKLDPRDRPTARELLDEGWFSVEQADMEENAIV